MNGWIKSKGGRDKYTTEEFRIVYVDIPPTGDGAYLPLLEYGLCLVTSFQRDYSKESGEKMGNTTSATWSRVALSVLSHFSGVYSLPDVMTMALHLCGLPPQHIQSQYNQNIRQTNIEEHYINYLTSTSQNGQSHQIQVKLEKLLEAKET